jgi:hypothetical protein
MRAPWILALVLATAWPAHAQDDPARQRAEDLFREGRELMKAGSVTDACIKFQQSLDTFESVGAALNLGQCHDFGARFASAVRAYERAARLARAAGDAERAGAADRFAEASRAKQSTVTIRIAELPGDGRVLLDGVEVTADALGQPQPVDPGDHRIVVQGATGPRWSTVVAIGGDAEQRVVDIPALGEARSGGGGGGGLDGMQTAGVVLLGLGGASLVVGAVFGGLAVSGKSDTEEACPGGVCPPEGQEVRDDAITKAHVSTAMIVIGGVAAASGLVLFLAGGGDGDAEAAELVPLVGWDGAGAIVRGRF